MQRQRRVCLDANNANQLPTSKWPKFLTRINPIFPGQQSRSRDTMRFTLLAGLASLASSVAATALTYRLEANEKACFYTNVDQANAKVAFYFAVRSALFPVRSICVLSAIRALECQFLTLTLFRSNPAAPSMSILPLPRRARRSS